MNVIWSFVPVRESSYVVSTNLAAWLGKTLQAEIHWTPEALNHKKINVLVIINGAYAFCKHLEVLAELVMRAKRIIWVQQDYTIRPPTITSEGESPFRAAFRKRHEKKLPGMDMWTTVHSRSKQTPDSRYVNWNALAYRPLPPVVLRKRGAGMPALLYYGAWRDACNAASGRGGRNTRYPYFARYFGQPVVKTVISSASKHFARYENKLCTIYDPFPKEDFLDLVSQHGLGLYIEDIMSHGGDHSPATRFYEMLSAGLPMVFQPEAVSGLERANIDVDGFVITKDSVLKNFMKNRDELSKAQRDRWSTVDHAREVESQVKKLWKQYLKGV
jgi:hypothetical protein